MLNNKAAYSYKTLYNKPFEIMKCGTNGMGTLQMGEIKLGIMYVSIIPIKLKTDVGGVHLYLPFIYFSVYIYIYMIRKNVYNQIRAWTLTHIVSLFPMNF